MGLRGGLEGLRKARPVAAWCRTQRVQMSQTWIRIAYSQVLGAFWELASVDAEKRVEAVGALLRELAGVSSDDALMVRPS
jgi:GH43 family beta-xylosidase